MSHEATNWAIKQRGLKPTTKIVLWHLCDRHNPDFGCFPSQARLAEDAEMSVSALNAHLARLEAAGLIRRLRCHDPRTHRRQTTRYILAFEPGFEPAPPHESGEDDDGSRGGGGEASSLDDCNCDADSGTDAELPHDPSPDCGHGSISGFSGEPSPDSGPSHLRNPETNLVREPLSKPVKEEEDAQAREAISEQFFGELIWALGLDPTALPGWWQGWPPREHVRRWRDDLGLDEDAILAVAEASRRDHPEPPDGPKALDRAMQRASQRLKQTSAQIAMNGSANAAGSSQKRNRNVRPMPSADEKAAFYADLVNSDRFLPSSAISNTMRDAMLARGLVTVERLRERGVR